MPNTQTPAFFSKISLIKDKLKQQMITKGTYKPSCPINLDRLKLINFSHYDFAGKIHNNGEIVVMDAAAEYVVNIFRELYCKKFPINKAKRIEYYNGNDELSLAANNTSCYNCRRITGNANLLSIHAYGLAIDINPVQNPYIELNSKSKQGEIKILPHKGKEYLNRTNLRPGMVEEIVDILKKNGFYIWGGTWNEPVDWQHFQTPRLVAEILAELKSEDAIEFFHLYAKEPYLFENIASKEEIYDKKFSKFWRKYIALN